MRINDEGKLVGRHLDFFGSTDLLRSKGLHMPNASSLEDIRISDAPETELGVDFCLTWNIDPRWDFIGYEPNNNPQLKGQSLRHPMKQRPAQETCCHLIIVTIMKHIGRGRAIMRKTRRNI